MDKRAFLEDSTLTREAEPVAVRLSEDVHIVVGSIVENLEAGVEEDPQRVSICKALQEGRWLAPFLQISTTESRYPT